MNVSAWVSCVLLAVSLGVSAGCRSSEAGIGRGGPDCPPATDTAGADRAKNSQGDTQHTPNVPRLIGGRRALLQLQRYPEAAREAGVEGRIRMRYLIDRQGHTQDHERVAEDFATATGAGPPTEARDALRQEALRVVRRLRYEPGRRGGALVCVVASKTLRWPLG